MNLKERWAQTTQWILARFARQPTWSRGISTLILGVTVAAAGTADYVTDNQMSLFVCYLVPVLLAVSWLGGAAGALTAIVGVMVRIVGDIMNVYPGTLPPNIWWSVGSAFVTFMCLVWVVDALIDLYRALEQRVAERTMALRTAMDQQQRLQHDLMVNGARERNAMGRELHDQLGQHFVATAMAAQVLAQRLEETQDPRTPAAKSIVHWIEEGVAKTRGLARGLLVAHIPPDRLGSELRDLATSCSELGVTVQFRQDGLQVEADPAACAQLFRIAQEAVSNAVRHGRARVVNIMLATDESATCLTVEDNGRGFLPAETVTEGMGLRIMKDRARFIGGSLSVLSSPGEGARVVVHLPVSVTVAP